MTTSAQALEALRQINVAASAAPFLDAEQMEKMAAEVARWTDTIRQHIESTAAELANERARGIHTCGPDCTRSGCVNARLREELEALRAFAQGVMSYWPHGDVDGGDLQELAAKHGLLKSETRTEPCGETCGCSEVVASDEWPDGVECFRKTPLLTGAALNQGGAG